MMSEQKTRIVVIGAGYAGLLLTVRLAGKTKGEVVEITLVNASDSFVERLRLHQYATNQAIKQRPITELLRGTGVQFMQGQVMSLDTRLHQVIVQTANGEQRVSYDNLVYAL